MEITLSFIKDSIPLLERKCQFCKKGTIGPVAKVGYFCNSLYIFKNERAHGRIVLCGAAAGWFDIMNDSLYSKNKMAWKVETTDEYDTWFAEQTGEGQASIRMKVELLAEYSPHLPRPYADTLKGSKLSNLKELRSQTEKQVFRVAFLFDEERKAVLLIGGDKKGKDEKRFYRKLIKQAEKIYAAYLR